MSLRGLVVAGDRWLRSWPHPALLAGALALLGLLGVVDHATGFELSFSLFYLAPISLASWYLGRNAGLSVSVAAAAVWLLVDRTSGRPYSQAWIPMWNAGVRLGFFLVTSLLLVELRRQLALERDLARLDPLTGLRNSRAFHEEAGLLFRLAARHRHPIALAYVDLDDFKRINDERGHEEGDRALAETGRLLSRSVRSTDVAARLGGDEFALLLPYIDLDDARRYFDDLQAKLTAMAAREGWPIGFSVGVAVFRDAPPAGREALQLADALMYRVKRGGKNDVVCEVVVERADPGAPQGDPGRT